MIDYENFKNINLKDVNHKNIDLKDIDLEDVNYENNNLEIIYNDILLLVLHLTKNIFSEDIANIIEFDIM